MSHEDLAREQHIEGSSDRSFGLVFAAVFLIIAAFPLFYGEGIRWGSVGVAGIFALLALLRPTLLSLLNRLWMKFGLLLGKIVSPIALGILFYLVITPIGIVIRLSGKDPLRLKFMPEADTYWILREPPGPEPGSLSKQF